ncbi:Bax inhibitor-1/YccA family protein [Sphingomonas sp. Mn802worker]|uniref:Bax inhibitor-1/YccA family protein n=1 Tax=Sphingomonas sp. Mn802worker TaxID=629773 RepID=UPI0003AA5739|nr:Bax inhibitor-1/YccA family protein [Sphingomonas sp. Mn802worker]
MANWSDPQGSTARFGAAQAGTRDAAHDAGLRSYMLSVYNYMTSGVLLTGIVALGFALSGYAAAVFQTPLRWLIVLAPLAFVFAMSFGQNRFSASQLRGMFWGFAVAMGLSLSTVFLVYSPVAIAQAFFATAAGFAALSLYGYTTKRDLSAFSTFLIIGVVGLLVASVINMFVNSGPLGFVISLVGVLLFAGLTAYDTQRTKSMYFQVAGHGELVSKAVVLAALTLYLDFINMFLFILRLFGSGRD